MNSARGAIKLVGALALGLVATGGCAGAGFGQAVRDDVSARMASIQQPLSDCYGAALQRNRKLAGTVTVAFVAESKTGRFKDVQPAGSSGDAELDSCVVTQVTSLKLEKPTDTNLAIKYPIEFAYTD